MAENQGNLTSSYPIPLDNNQSQKVLYPDGITSLAEDYAQQEQIREYEDLVRLNSIAKTPGIVTLKANEAINILPYTGRKLFPYTNDNALIIKSGIGFTRNGAMILLTNDIVIPSTSYNLIPNYTTDLSGKSVYLVLRKKTYDAFKRSHPITGEQQDTRRYIVSDKSCIEFLVISNNENYTGKIFDYDKDIVVLAKITNVNSPTIEFDYSRVIGGREFIRSTETPTAEVGGFTMEGNINMNNVWELLNLPLLGSSYWKNNGTPNNFDFTKLYMHTNYKLGLLRDLKFEDKGSGTYALTFTNPNTLTKIKIFPTLAPPKSIEIKVSNVSGYSINIPDNNVCYLKLNDTASGFNEANGIVGKISGEEEITEDNIGNINYQLLVGDFSTITTINNADRLRLYPICWHYTNGTDRKLIFPNGIMLNIGEEINDKGKYSGYVDTNGDRMIGDLEIYKNDPTLYLTQTVKDDNITIFPGIKWKDGLGNIVGEFYRKYSQENTTGVAGDHILSVTNPTDNSVKFFDFKRDGRLKVRGTPIENDDVVTLGYANSSTTGFVRKAGDIMIGDLVFMDEAQPIVKSINPTIVLMDITPENSYQSFTIKREDNKLIGRIIRFSEDGTQFGYPEIRDGDMLFETWTSNQSYKGQFLLRARRKNPTDPTQKDDILIIPNLHIVGMVESDVNIGERINKRKLTINTENVLGNFIKINRRAQLFY